jgi:alpha-tubulin suppressor-like RCC1 family protein
VLTIVAGEEQDLAVAFDGTVWSWSAEATPRQVPGVSDVVAVASGERQASALKSDGTVWQWALGAAESAPTMVPGLAQVIAIAEGAEHHLALRGDGTVWSWGANRSGQLGDGSEVDRLEPAPVAGLEHITSIAAGDRHSLALTSDGSLWGWGDNTAGQLADTTGLTHSSTPMLIVLKAKVATPTFTPAAGTIAVDTSISVAINCTTSGATIRYTTDGSTPNASSPVYTTPISVGTTTTIKAYATAPGLTDSSVATGIFTPQAQTPTFTPGAGTYNVNQNVALASTTTGVTIRYTTNGTTPTGSSPAYTAPISVAQTTTLKAIAFKTGWANSAMATGVFTLQVVAPTMSPVAGTYNVTQSVVLSTTTSGATIRYTTDGSTPTAMSTLYSTPISVTQTTTIKAIGLKTGWSNSTVASAVYTLQVVTPTMSPVAGTYNANQSVALSTTTSGATIRYTTNGSPPTSMSPLYSTPISVTQTTTINAIALKTGWSDSTVATALYTLQVATPTFSPGGGTYSTAQTVTIATTTAGATLRYTIDGSTPTTSSPQYSTPIPISTGTTLKARGFKTGWMDSAVGSAVYVFNYGTLAAPTIAPDGGAYTASVNVTMTAPSGTIHYTTDGAEPSVTSPTYVSAVTLTQTATVKAKAFQADWTPSATTASTYWLNLGTVGSPVLNPAPGTYTSAQSVTASAAGGTTLRYTTDGTEPSYSSAVYSGPIAVDLTTALKVKAFKADMTPSATAGGLYVIDLGTVDAPRFGLAGGQYSSLQYVTVTAETAGATIHYTTNDLEPFESDPTVASGGKVVVDQSMVLKAKAWKTGSTPSATRVATYAITGALTVGSNFTLALKADGSVWAWGDNNSAQLGNPSLPPSVPQTTPVAVPELSDIVAISAGNLHGLALKRDGTVWSWGRNTEGQLGRSAPNPARVGQVDVFILTRDVVGIAAGETDSLAVKRDGTVWIWGVVGGYPSGPVQVANLSGVAGVAVGSGHRAVSKTDGEIGGRVWSWGLNIVGQLGDGTTIDKAAPVATAGLSSVVEVAAGLQHGLALKSDGAVWAWGSNGVGSLGDGTTTTRLSPVLSQGLDSVTAVGAGSAHSLALRSDGSVWTWGWNAYGPLGTGGGTDAHAPQASLMTDAVVVALSAAGANHVAAARADGTVWTWGNNDRGQLGDGTTSGNAFPHPISDFALTQDALLSADSDGDGLTNAEEYALGSDPRNPDTNGDGVLDGAANQAGISLTNLDMDGDGVSNADERTRGTDPFMADTDGDGVADGQDCFPLDPTRWQCPVPDPNDHTPPVITLQEPTDATLISSVPPE